MEKSKLYTKYLKEINSMLQNVNKLNADLKSETTILNDIEIIDIRKVFNHLINNLEDAKMSIDDFSKPIREGILFQNEDGKFEIIYPNGKHSYAFSCGSPIEVYLEGLWQVGRVEYTTTKGYYFYGNIKPSLKDNMRSRVEMD